ncbi:MAG: hypothetical protein ACHQAY_03780 [Hyphomicrobiales bacterium]
MADYYPLLSRAIVNLGDSAGPDVRRAIYDRARTTLRSQLEAADPPLPHDQIERERAQLEAVIARLEIEARARTKPSRQPPLRYTQPLERSEDQSASQPEATAGAVEPVPGAPQARERETASDHVTEPPARLDPPAKPGAAARLPTIDWRIAALVVAAVLVVGTLAGLAYAFRDQVDPVRREEAEQAAANPAAPQAAPDTKLSARLGAPAPAAVAPDTAPRIAVAQRATLFIEVPGAADQVPRTVAGRVVWSFDNLPSKPGQPLDPALVGSVEIPDAGITLKMQMTRNRDASLPASYLVGLIFTTKDSNVKDIAPVLMKADESERGTPLIGIQQPLGPNLFVMALSAADADIAKNFDLLTKRGWVEVQFRLADQRRGAIVFEKGIAGDRALLTAIDAWK